MEIDDSTRAKGVALLLKRGAADDESGAVELEETLFRQSEIAENHRDAYLSLLRETASRPRTTAREAEEAKEMARRLEALPGKSGVAQGLFKCHKCKSSKTKHTESQTRSADEPMTVTVKCLEPFCGASRKFNP